MSFWSDFVKLFKRAFLSKPKTESQGLVQCDWADLRADPVKNEKTKKVKSAENESNIMPEYLGPKSYSSKDADFIDLSTIEDKPEKAITTFDFDISGIPSEIVINADNIPSAISIDIDSDLVFKYSALKYEPFGTVPYIPSIIDGEWPVIPITEIKTLDTMTITDRIDTSAIENNIRQHAYFKWEAAGKPEGKDQEFWDEAEKEFMGRLVCPHAKCKG